MTTASNHSLYKHWEANPFTIAYAGNGASGGSTASHPCTYDKNCYLSNNGFTKTSYTFNGWKKENTGIALKAGANVKNATTVRNATVTYYAQWCRNCVSVSHGSCTLNAATPGTCKYTTSCTTGYHVTAGNATYNPTCTANTFTIAYAANGGSGSTSSHTCTYDQNCTLRSNGFKRAGYIFAGWKKGNSGSTLAVGTNVKNVVTSGTVTYYAQWTPCSAGRYSGLNDTTCKLCPAGQYQNATAQATCKACPVGHYQNASGRPSCNVCPAGQYQNLTGQAACKNCPTCFTSSAGATSCYDYVKPTLNPWQSTTMGETSLTYSRATFVLGNLGNDCGSGLARIKYWTSCDGTQRYANISGNSARLTIPACADTNVALYYKLIDAQGNESEQTMGVGRIGIYAAYAQVYNYMLFDGPVPNNDANLKGHVDATPGGQVWVRVRDVLINTAINAYPGRSNDDYVARLYKSILGRDQEIIPEQGGACTWRIYLHPSGYLYTDGNGCKGWGKGHNRYQVLTPYFCANPEPKGIHAAWGFEVPC